MNKICWHGCSDTRWMTEMCVPGKQFYTPTPNRKVSRNSEGKGNFKSYKAKLKSPEEWFGWEGIVGRGGGLKPKAQK